MHPNFLHLRDSELCSATRQIPLFRLFSSLPLLDSYYLLSVHVWAFAFILESYRLHHARHIRWDICFTLFTTYSLKHEESCFLLSMLSFTARASASCVFERDLMYSKSLAFALADPEEDSDDEDDEDNEGEDVEENNNNDNDDEVNNGDDDTDNVRVG